MFDVLEVLLLQEQLLFEYCTTLSILPLNEPLLHGKHLQLQEHLLLKEHLLNKENYGPQRILLILEQYTAQEVI